MLLYKDKREFFFRDLKFPLRFTSSLKLLTKTTQLTYSSFYRSMLLKLQLKKKPELLLQQIQRMMEKKLKLKSPSSLSMVLITLLPLSKIKKLNLLWLLMMLTQLNLLFSYLNSAERITFPSHLLKVNKKDKIINKFTQKN